MRWIFVGSNGIRAGWRLAMFVAFFMLAGGLLSLAVGVGIYLSGHHDVGAVITAARRSGQLTPLAGALSEAVPFVATLIATWAMSRIERRPMGIFGLPLGEAFRGRFWEGALLGFLAITLTLALTAICGDFRITALRETGPVLFIDAIEWAMAFCMTGLAEDYLFRGYLQFTLTTGTRFWFAAFLTSAAFAGVHLGNKGETAIGIGQVALIGIVECVMLWRTGNLWFGVGVHAAWDWAETYFYGVPDSGFVTPHALLASSISGPAWLSGGSDGPEGSIFGLIVLVAVGAYVWLRFKGSPYPWPPLRKASADHVATT